MIDSFKFSARATDFGLPFFEVNGRSKMKRRQDGQQIIWNDEIKGIRFTFYGYSHMHGASYIEMEGSLDKFINGDNAQNTSALTLKEGLIKLSKLIKLKVPETYNRFGFITPLDFRINRLDIAINLWMNKPVEEYLKYIDSFPRYHEKRKKEGTEREFRSRNQSKTVIFYDKSQEYKDKRSTYDYKYQSAKLDGPKFPVKDNILRIEFRALENAGRVFGIKKVRELGQRKNIIRLFAKLNKVFNQTVKYESAVFNSSLTLGEIDKGIHYLGIQSLGGFDNFDRMLAILKRDNNLRYAGPERLKNFNRKIKASRKANNILKSPKEMIELKAKFTERMNIALNGFYICRPHPEFIQNENGEWELKDKKMVYSDLVFERKDK